MPAPAALWARFRAARQAVLDAAGCLASGSIVKRQPMAPLLRSDECSVLIADALNSQASEFSVEANRNPVLAAASVCGIPSFVARSISCQEIFASFHGVAGSRMHGNVRFLRAISARSFGYSGWISRPARTRRPGRRVGVQEPL